MFRLYYVIIGRAYEQTFYLVRAKSKKEAEEIVLKRRAKTKPLGYEETFLGKEVADKVGVISKRKKGIVFQLYIGE
jgi:hypothetical protein